jgi:hypothetical protein
MNHQSKAFFVVLLLLTGCKSEDIAPRTRTVFRPVAPRQITMGLPQLIFMEAESRRLAIEVLEEYFSRTNYVIDRQFDTFGRRAWCTAPPLSGEIFRDGVVDLERLGSVRTESECLAVLGEPEIRSGPLPSVAGRGVALWQWRFYNGKSRPASATEVNVGVAMKADKLWFIIVRVGDATPL